ncbi:VirB4 family type IV secretion system protein [Haloarcula amylovorans]|uniref:VirB4 family type IV secretion system protein n=1 Tax=Haloarcula amylovorans TaxID=2562280 RepID=UPI00107632FA|nr:transfer complex protein [Halomicroarcula amylolytica]
MSNNSQTTKQTRKDPGQLVPPRVDTDPELLGGYTWSDMKVYAPATASLLGSGVGVATSSPILTIGGLVGGLGLGLTGTYLRVSDRAYTSPRGRVSAWSSHLRRQYLDSPDDVLADVTGVCGVTERGFLEMDDGRYVAPVPVEPRNTAMLDADQRHRLAASLSSAIDEQLTDMPFRFYSTTRETNVDEIAERYEQRALNPETNELQQSVLLDVADWLTEADAPNWEARDWRHYVVVEADASAVMSADEPSFIDILNPLADADAVSDSAVEATLADRVETVQAAIGSVTGLEARNPTPHESLTVAREYWGRDDDLPDELVEDLVGDGRDGEYSEDLTDRLARVVEPETWDPRNGWVEVGDQYATALWLAEYPTETASLWLKDLCTLRGVDFDVTVNVNPVPLNDGVHEAGAKAADIGSEGEERAEERDITAMDTETAGEATRKLRELFRQTPSQPWRLSTYVVVRADDQDALDAATEELATFDDVEGAKRRALQTARETVRDTLTGAPANTTPVIPGAAQECAFRAASPLTGDRWDAETPAEKDRLVPGAVIGSMFPFAALDRREATGMDWGRNEENGSHLRLSPFERGGGPHMLTIGQTRSGKTYSASKAALRWYLERDDRTLIVCDTQRGFDGLTQLCDGEHIVVDGNQSVNPLRIEPSPDHRAEGADEFRMTVEETVGFLVGLLRADDVTDAGEYAPLLAQAAERTLTNAGIEPGQPETFDAGNPNLSDLLETLTDMTSNPEEYTMADGEGHEGETHLEQVGELLTKLRSFQEGGKYESLLGADELGLLDEDVDMAYLDLHAVGGSNDAEKSANLQLMLSQVREKIKQTDGEVVCMFDEAHVLLDADRTADWLQKAAREFARYDASLWFLSQSPKDFVSGDGETDARDTIRAQCSTVHFFRTPRVDEDVLAQFGLNSAQREFVQDIAVRGKEGRGYSECLIDAEDIEGWIPCYVEATPLEDRVLTYSRREAGGHGTAREDFVEHMTDGTAIPSNGESGTSQPADATGENGGRE